MMVSLAMMTAVVSMAAVSRAVVSTANESIAAAEKLSIGWSIRDVSSERESKSESESLLRPMALPASMPNDCIAAIITSRAGIHIFAINRFIQDGKGTNFFVNSQIVWKD